MGWPVAHSLSPRLHNYWLEKYGIDGAYVPLAVKPEEFEAAVRALPKLGFRGCNVTIPHKEAAAKIVDHLEPLAAAIGAVNTIIVREDGSLEGRNTDAPGFIANLVETLGDWSPAGKRAVVLGAGGAARGIVAALAQAGAKEIAIVNRTRERAHELTNDLAVHFSKTCFGAWDWPYMFDRFRDADLLVNTTSLGQTGQPKLDADLLALMRGAIVTDIVYNPLETDLLKKAKARGLRTVDGLGMLIQQARAGFEAWFGVKPEADEATRAHLLAALAEKK